MKKQIRIEYEYEYSAKDELHQFVTNSNSNYCLQLINSVCNFEK